ncbi:uridine kinase [Egicoccus halophilus]|uniref:uridine kinase n=1 Tax=Egicoccus halophilus TaxID=1670830 RepID=UPI00197A8275|nr:uridine kinase [Egicoccus halophilus]
MTSPASPPPADARLRARVVLLSGPSGSGKSSLAARVGLPTVCLDDFYRDGDDPALPVGELGIVDWDDPASWNADRAVAALVSLAREGRAELPVYDIPSNRAVDVHTVALGDAPLVVAEGIFAAELVERCRTAGILADAVCLTNRPLVTFWRRLGRDLREGRKPPLTLVRRGLHLLRREPRIVAHQVTRGATPLSTTDAVAHLRRLIDETAVAADRGEDAA